VTFGALQELGACVFNTSATPSDPAVTHNPSAWNSNATVIFVDQPLGVGFSYGKRRVGTLTAATADLYGFLERLFAARPDWAARDFYIAGESYGGSWVPALAAFIQERQTSPMAKMAARTSMTSPVGINLKGIMIGNGLIDQTAQRRGFFEMGCTRPGGILNETQCQAAVEVGPSCERVQEACRASGFDRSVCNVSDSVCQEGGWFLIRQTPWNPYDVRINCTAEPDRCVDPPPGLVKWIDSHEVRTELGVDDAAGPVNPISEQITDDFFANGEVGYPSHQWVSQMLDEVTCSARAFTRLLSPFPC